MGSLHTNFHRFHSEQHCEQLQYTVNNEFKMRMKIIRDTTTKNTARIYLLRLILLLMSQIKKSNQIDKFTRYSLILHF